MDDTTKVIIILLIFIPVSILLKRFFDKFEEGPSKKSNDDEKSQ